MSTPALVIARPGLSASFQDRGRVGLARFGVPPGGAMDDHAAAWANRLLGNAPDAPVVELLLQGAELVAQADVTIAITGADAQCSAPVWRAVNLRRGDQVTFPASRSGLWIYVAIEGGFEAPRYFGSASVYPSGRIGRTLTSGDVLRRRTGVSPGSRVAHDVADRRDYARPPRLRVWRGPQWTLFSSAVHASFFRQPWTVSSQSDRVGYRLDGAPLTPAAAQIASEPVLVGSIQVPPHGQPIVTMRDGPTVGGYPKIGLVDPDDVSWLAQCRPGTQIGFELIDE